MRQILYEGKNTNNKIKVMKFAKQKSSKQEV